MATRRTSTSGSKRMTAPSFTYCPHPERSGAIEPSDEVCSCCNTARGYAYALDIVSDDLPDSFREVCPWCIADGLAASNYGIVFNDPDVLAQRGLAKDIIEGITLRTPSYSSWQTAAWECHCDDACEFHGDLTVEEAHAPDWQAVAEMLNSSVASAQKTWPEYAARYVPADPSIFKFVCRHCQKVTYQIDTP
ncbi:MAG: CbrC family protein [Pirellulaceae bacterium]|nr:CbrC family protein [Pirellulaceae bacterium]